MKFSHSRPAQISNVEYQIIFLFYNSIKYLSRKIPIPAFDCENLNNLSLKKLLTKSQNMIQFTCKA